MLSPCIASIARHAGCAGVTLLCLHASIALGSRAARADDCNWTYDPAIGQPGLDTPGVGSAAWAFGLLDGDLIAGGSFISAGGQYAPGIARWDGTQWMPMGGFSGSVRSLEMFQGSLHAFGQFRYALPATEAWRAARWNGSSWQALGADHGLLRPSDTEAATAYTSVVRGDSIIVGGTFTRAGDQPVGLVAAWDGVAWHPLGAGFDSLSSDSGTCAWATYPSVLALTVYNGDLIAGGTFKLTAEGDTVHCIARWDGTAWHSLGGGMGRTESDCGPPWVHALTVWNGDLIVGGSFRTAGGQLMPRVARWDGTSWHAMGNGWNTPLGSQVWELTVTQSGELIAAGFAQECCIIDKWQIARWNGTDWEQVGPDLSWGGPGAAVSTLFPWGADLAVSGGFTSTVDGDTMNFVSILRCNATTTVTDAASPLALELRTAGANPFFASAQIVFTLPRAAAHVTLEVHDLAGSRVRTLYAGPIEAGERRAEWSGRRDDGRRVPPGVYFAHLRVGNNVRTLRLVRL